MADNTQIEWTDATWNVVTGCSVVSPGCANCYAMKLAGTRMQHHPSRAGLTIDTKAGPVWTGEVRFNEAWLTQPLTWKRPRRIFVAAHGDLFHEGVPMHQLDRIFAIMALCPQHTFQILTKRPWEMQGYMTGYAGRADETWRPRARVQKAVYEFDQDHCIHEWPLPNVWMGVSVEDQVRADERIPLLLDTPAAVRWISAEPLLGPVNLRDAMWAGDGDPSANLEASIDWVVVGGESGKGARPMHPAWARQIRDQCAETDTAFLFKQWGAWGPGVNIGPSTSTEEAAWWFGDRWDFRNVTVRESEEMHCDDEPDLWRVGKTRAGRMLDGVIHDGYPEAGR